jgi:hypothetical protein
MSKSKKTEIEYSINYLTCVLEKLKTKIDENDEYNRVYNSLLVKRAILRQKLAQSGTNKLFDILKENLNLLKFSKKERLICDYFSTPVV